MRAWRPINETAWPFRFEDPAQEFTEDSAPDGGTVSKDGSPHLSRRHAARRTATGTNKTLSTTQVHGWVFGIRGPVVAPDAIKRWF